MKTLKKIKPVGLTWEERLVMMRRIRDRRRKIRK